MNTKMRKQTIFYIALVIIVLLLIWVLANIDAIFPTPKDTLLSNLGALR